MYELHPTRLPSIRRLFSELEDPHGSVRAVLAGAAPGQVWLDRETDPRVALLKGPEGYYLGGAPALGQDHATLRETIPDWAYVYLASDWCEHEHMALPHRHMQQHHRVYLTVDTTARPSMDLPQGLHLSDGPDDPISTLVFQQEEVVAWCTPDMIVGDYAELGVWTRPDYRRSGLAKAVVTAAINRASLAGIRQIGWHCLASNKGSLAVAKSVGFDSIAACHAWSASLPAENPGDMIPTDLRRMAAAFEKGRSELPWLDFHAAVAWTQAGDQERAISVLERLVEKGWEGQADWLQSHWGLAPLQGLGRFSILIEKQFSR